jgi:Flp pilus assembly protein TadD
MDRIEIIRKMLAEKGEDAFLRYSLGMELAGAGRHDEAVEEFARCIAADPDYVAAYTESGKALRAAGKIDQARQMFRQALDLAGRLNQSHTRDYIQQQLEALG